MQYISIILSIMTFEPTENKATSLREEANFDDLSRFYPVIQNLLNKVDNKTAKNLSAVSHTWLRATEDTIRNRFTLCVPGVKVHRPLIKARRSFTDVAVEGKRNIRHIPKSVERLSLAHITDKTKVNLNLFPKLTWLKLTDSALTMNKVCTSVRSLELDLFFFTGLPQIAHSIANMKFENLETCKFVRVGNRSLTTFVRNHPKLKSFTANSVYLELDTFEALRDYTNLVELNYSPTINVWHLAGLEAVLNGMKQLQILRIKVNAIYDWSYLDITRLHTFECIDLGDYQQFDAMFKHSTNMKCLKVECTKELGAIELIAERFPNLTDLDIGLQYLQPVYSRRGTKMLNLNTLTFKSYIMCSSICRFSAPCLKVLRFDEMYLERTSIEYIIANFQMLEEVYINLEYGFRSDKPCNVAGICEFVSRLPKLKRLEFKAYPYGKENFKQKLDEYFENTEYEFCICKRTWKVLDLVIVMYRDGCSTVRFQRRKRRVAVKRTFDEINNVVSVAT